VPVLAVTNHQIPAKISGSLLDRIDIPTEAPALSIRQLQNDKPGESHPVIRGRIQAARERQLLCFAGTKLTVIGRGKTKVLPYAHLQL
jgi:predicted ATPase with chaperone activity